MQKVQELIGYRIRRRRMALGLMQHDLALRAEMPQEHISRLERGEFVAVNMGRFVGLVQALRTSADYLLGLSEEAGPVEDIEPAMPVGA